MITCSGCGALFECGMETADNNGTPCWCTQLPPLPRSAYQQNLSEASTARCFCPNCLRALLASSETGPQTAR